jgi:hypothetical protein
MHWTGAEGADGEPSSMEAKTIGMDRRQFLSGVSVAAIAGIPFGVLPTESEQGAALWTGTILHAAVGQRIPLAGGRELTIKVDSQVTPGVRMSMVAEDLPQARKSRFICTSGKTRSSSSAWAAEWRRSATGRFQSVLGQRSTRHKGCGTDFGTPATAHWV